MDGTSTISNINGDDCCGSKPCNEDSQEDQTQQAITNEEKANVCGTSCCQETSELDESTLERHEDTMKNECFDDPCCKETKEEEDVLASKGDCCDDPCCEETKEEEDILAKKKEFVDDPCCKETKKEEDILAKKNECFDDPCCKEPKEEDSILASKGDCCDDPCCEETEGKGNVGEKYKVGITEECCGDPSCEDESEEHDLLVKDAVKPKDKCHDNEVTEKKQSAPTEVQEAKGSEKDCSGVKKKSECNSEGSSINTLNDEAHTSNDSSVTMKETPVTISKFVGGKAVNKTVKATSPKKNGTFSMKDLLKRDESTNLELEDGATAIDIRTEDEKEQLLHPTNTYGSVVIIIEPAAGTADDSDDRTKATGVVTTKIRVQNICCGKEADLMEKELKKLSGIISVAVNIVGRVAFIKHDQGTLPVSDVVRYLNSLHLGVSVMESGTKKQAADDTLFGFEWSLIYHIACLLVVIPLYIAMIVGKALNSHWEKWVAICVIIVGGLPILIKVGMAWKKKLFIDINVLMLLAIIGTIALREWMEGATVILAFGIAEVLQRYSRHKVLKMIAGLVIQTPEVAALAETGEVVPVEDIAIGTKIVICAGEKIPLDGLVVKGQGAVDESTVTGESVPTSKQQGSTVYGGTILQNGFLQVETTSDSTNSMMSRVSQLVSEAQARSSHTEKLMNRFAQFYTPAVLVVSLLIFVIPAALFSVNIITQMELYRWGYRALVILLIACPCALLMAAPIAVVSSIGFAAREGVLIKGGPFLESLGRVKVIALDKTGTLTEGRFRVAQLNSMGDSAFTEDKLLSVAAAVEKKSSHPLATAIVNHYSGCITDKIEDLGVGVGLPDVNNFKSITGSGVTGEVEGHLVSVGNLNMMRNNGCDITGDLQEEYYKWSHKGLTVILMGVDSKVELMISLADLPRESSAAALSALAKLGVQCVVLTGDNAGAAAMIRNAVGAEEVIAEMKPEEKLQWIEEKKKGTGRKKCVVAMVGDGVNDGPSLAAADVGIAIGVCGTALAIESAGVALMSDNLTKIPKMMQLSRFCRRLIIQNIALAVLIKLAIVVAALFVSLDLWIAVVADVVSLLLVILNGLRPLRWDSKDIDIVEVAEGNERERLITAL